MTDNPTDSVVTDTMPQMVAAGAMAYRSITGGSVNYDAMQAALEAALPLAMSQASPPPSDEVERLLDSKIAERESEFNSLTDSVVTSVGPNLIYAIDRIRTMLGAHTGIRPECVECRIFDHINAAYGEAIGEPIMSQASPPPNYAKIAKKAALACVSEKFPSTATYETRIEQVLREELASPPPLSDEAERVRDALTPSAETKAAYHGEFWFEIENGVTNAGIERFRKVYVPWTTIKEIMAAICDRAALTACRMGGTDA